MRIMTRDRSFYRSLVLLAVPVALQNLITFAVTFADNLMVSSLGDSAVAGVYLGSQLQTFLQMFSAGIEGAILILAAQYWGKRDTGSIKRIISIGVRLSVAVGALLTVGCALLPGQILSLFTSNASPIRDGCIYLRIVCFSYIFFCLTQALIAAMRSVEQANIGLFVSLISLGVNILLNYVLIFGKFGFPAMGIAGAAIATLISRIVETCVIAIYVFRIDRKLCIAVRDLLAPAGVLLKDFIGYGLPIVAGQVVWSINLMMNSAILGRFPESVLAATSVANTMNSLAYVFITGMSNAVSVITGKTVGTGNVAKVREYARTTQILFLAMGLFVGALVALLKRPFASLYSDLTPEATAFAVQFMTVLSVTIIGTCYQAVGLAGLVKAGGDTRFVFINDSIFVFLVVIPSALLAVRLGAPAWVVFACLKCDQILKCFVAVVKINSFNWIHDLTRQS